MTKVSIKDIEQKVNLLNQLTNSPSQPYSRANGVLFGNKGCYHLEQAYGGIKLIRMCEGTGTMDISKDGFGTKKQLMAFLNSFIAGLTSTGEL